jgi:spermidine/putrescine transport system permease protein
MTTPNVNFSSTSTAPWLAWLLLSPLLAWLVAFVVAPEVILLVYSFLRAAGPGEVAWSFTLDNYRGLMEPYYGRILLRSIGYAATTTLLCVLIGYPVAYHIGRMSPRWRSRLLVLVMIPFSTSFLIRAYAWFILLMEHGLLKSVLETTRLIPSLFPRDVQLLYTPGAVLIALVYTYLPFVILPVYGSVEKLDVSLLEAAADLGAGPWRAFLRVILPLTMPGVVAGVLLVFVPSVAMFAVTSVMGGGRVLLIGDVIQDQFTSSGGNLPLGAAMGVALLVLFLLSFLLIGRRKDAQLFG